MYQNPNEGLSLALSLKEQMIADYIDILKNDRRWTSPLCPGLYYQSYHNMRDEDTQEQISNFEKYAANCITGGY